MATSWFCPLSPSQRIHFIWPICGQFLLLPHFFPQSPRCPWSQFPFSSPTFPHIPINPPSLLLPFQPIALSIIEFAFHLTSIHFHFSVANIIRLFLLLASHFYSSFRGQIANSMAEPGRRIWPIRFGGLLEMVNGNDIDPSGRTDLLKLMDEAKYNGKLLEEDLEENAIEWPDQLKCDCTELSIVDGQGELLATMPLHQLASVGFVREPPKNILAFKVGDVVEGAPDLFDLLLLYSPSEEMAEEICRHFVHCFQFLYREAISTMEQVELEGGEGEMNANIDHHHHPNLELAKKFVAVSSTSASLCSSPISPLHSPPLVDEPRHQNVSGGANSTSTSSNSTRQAVELINEYLTMLSACLSHDELNKFAILMRRWRAREMPILEFAQKLLELYGPERRYLLARMRSLLRGDPADLEALSDFLRANGVVENAAASPPLTAEMSLGSLEAPQTASCPPSANADSIINSHHLPQIAHHGLHQHSHSSS